MYYFKVYIAIYYIKVYTFLQIKNPIKKPVNQNQLPINKNREAEHRGKARCGAMFGYYTAKVVAILFISIL